MDKEFLDKVLACKTADELRALLDSKRQLSDSELEQVAGGRAGGFGGFTWEEAGPAFQAILDKFGEESAVSFANQYLARSVDWTAYLKQSR